MAASFTLTHLLPCRQQGFCKCLALFFRLAQKVESQSLGRTGANPWQLLELLNQPSQGAGEGRQLNQAVRANLGRLGRKNGISLLLLVASMKVSAWLRGLPRLCCVVLLLLLVSCSAAAAGLNRYSSADGRYAFLYPTGWIRVAISDGPEVVFHDLINSDETLSLVIAPVDPEKRLEELGSAVTVGEKLGRKVIAPVGSGRQAELVEASEREDQGRIFYDLEYKVHLADRDRHEIATVVADKGKLYTLAASTNEVRWDRVSSMFRSVVTSFTLNY
jgi:photosystem II oxygen-evolving enhancer protein 2